MSDKTTITKLIQVELDLLVELQLLLDKELLIYDALDAVKAENLRLTGMLEDVRLKRKKMEQKQVLSKPSLHN